MYNDLVNILTNITSNAVDAITGQGSIIFGANREADDLILTIEDTGSSIKEADLDRIFDMDYTTKPTGKGTGMGLYIVKKLTSRIGWEINIKSDYDKSTAVHLIKRGYYNEKTD